MASHTSLGFEKSRNILLKARSRGLQVIESLDHLEIVKRYRLKLVESIVMEAFNTFSRGSQLLPNMCRAEAIGSSEDVYGTDGIHYEVALKPEPNVVYGFGEQGSTLQRIAEQAREFGFKDFGIQFEGHIVISFYDASYCVLWPRYMSGDWSD